MTLSVALIGAGYFAGFHAEAWSRNPDTRLAGVADPEPGKAALLAAQTEGPDNAILTMKDPAALLGDLAPDIVDIAAPPSAHLGLIRAALAAAPRVVVCQKPFCGSLGEAETAAALAAEAGVPLVVHENFRFQPWYRCIRETIAAGDLGDLYQITFRLRPGDGQGPQAYLDRQPYFQRMERFLVHETAVHWIDTFRFLMGEPEAVSADLRRLNPAIAGEDAGAILFRFPDGRRALFDGNRLADHAATNPRLTMGECLVEGSAATVTLDGFGTLRLRPRGATEARAIGWNWPLDRFGGDCVYALQAHIVGHIMSGSALENEARNYLRNMRIEAAIYDAAATERTIRLTGD